MALETEWETYQRELPGLLDRSGKYALIAGETVVDVLDTYNDAVKEGYRRFGIDTPFMVKQISAMEPVLYFSRNIGP